MCKDRKSPEGGPFHPVKQQAEVFKTWLPDGYEVTLAHSTEAFNQLEDCDLFVAAGLNWTGMGANGDGLGWDYDDPFGYRPTS